jgi:hypothetical protein
MPPGYALAAVVAGALVAVGSFLPWATVGAGILTASKTGIEGGDGWLTLILGAVAALVSASALIRGRLPNPGLLVSVGVVLVAVAAWEGFDILNRQSATIYGLEIKPSPGVGLLAVAAGAIGLVVVALAANRKGR